MRRLPHTSAAAAGAIDNPLSLANWRRRAQSHSRRRQLRAPPRVDDLECCCCTNAPCPVHTHQTALATALDNIAHAKYPPFPRDRHAHSCATYVHATLIGHRWHTLQREDSHTHTRQFPPLANVLWPNTHTCDGHFRSNNARAQRQRHASISVNML